jgi:hypothetical protein
MPEEEMSMASMILKDVLAVAIVATSIGCVGSPAKPSSLAQDSAIVSPGPTAPAPQLGQTVATPQAQTVPASNHGAPGVNRFNVAMSHSGTATVTLTWPNGDFSLQLYVTRGACADASGLVAGACTILGTTRPGTRPGLVTSAVVSGDMITVWVLNPDEDPQTFTVGVEIH